MVRFQLWLATAVSIIAFGWTKPLGVRLSGTAPTPAPVVAPATPRPWGLNGTALDRAPYKKTPSGVVYTNNIDFQKNGTATETERKSNMTVSGTTGSFTSGGAR